MLGIAGREADIVGILPKALPDGTISDDLAERTPETLKRKVGWVRDAAGDRDVELSAVISPVIADDHGAAAERYAVERGWGSAATEQVLAMPSAFLGSPDRIAEQMLTRCEEYGFSYYVVSDRDLDAFSPVVERLAGCRAPSGSLNDARQPAGHSRGSASRSRRRPR
jgi:alkanesulfonate monooxygenase SsuD/methylene tetrahydromethanopterin reductase-like flavin-dependent oxidoreductase (luciferase family)